MGKRPSDGMDPERINAVAPKASSSNAEVTALRGMSREARIELLMKGLDATCGPVPVRRRETVQSVPAKNRRKD